MNSVPRLIFKVGALLLAVGMLGGYMWYTQRQEEQWHAQQPQKTPPRFDPRVTSKSADVVFTTDDTTAIQNSTPSTQEAIRLSSKTGTVFSGVKLEDPLAQPQQTIEDEFRLKPIGPGTSVLPQAPAGNPRQISSKSAIVFPVDRKFDLQLSPPLNQPNPPPPQR